MNTLYKRFWAGSSRRAVVSLTTLFLLIPAIMGGAKGSSATEAVRAHARTPNAVQPYAELTKLVSSDSTNQFGIAVALSNDGSTALIGVRGTTSNGRAEVYIRNGAGWQQQAILSLPGSPNNALSVALSSDGNIALVGTPFIDSDGATFVFTRAGTEWTQQAKLSALNGAPGDNFGFSVALDSNGTTALIGAYATGNNKGTAYVFTRAGTTWTQQTTLTAPDTADGDRFALSVSLSNDGNTALIAAKFADTPAIDSGTAYVFSRSGVTWTQQAKLLAGDRAPGDQFGFSVALSGDGATALIGATHEDTGLEDNGAAYIFARSGTTWTQQAKLLALDRQTIAFFGYATALSDNGNTALIGAYRHSTPPLSANGQAYIFQRSGLEWTQQKALVAKDRASDDQFGHSVAISDNGIVSLIGANLDDNTSITDRGAAYIFTWPAQYLGCYDPISYSFFLSDPGGLITIAGYGSLPGDVPLAGDWNDDGVDTIGIYRRATGEFFLRNSNTVGAPDYQLVLGNPNDIPLQGRWALDMAGDGVGVFRPSNGILYLKKTLATGFADFFLVMGNAGDIGVAGDWDGNGIDSPGVYRVDEGNFYLTNQVTNGIVNADFVFAFGSGTNGAANPYRDIPMIGDWDANRTSTAGVYHAENGIFHLRNSNTAGAPDTTRVFCSPGALPISGHWSN